MAGRAIRLLLTVALAVVLALGSAAVVIGYVDQTNIQIQLSGPSGTIKCDRVAAITARVVSLKNGKPVANQIVRWDLVQSQSSADGLTAASTVTDGKGTTHVSLVFGPVAGARSVRASASTAGSSVTVRCAGGLPATAARPPDGFVIQPSAALLAPPVVTEAPPAELPATRLRVERLGIDVDLVEGDGFSVPEGQPPTIRARPGRGRGPTRTSTPTPARVTSWSSGRSAGVTSWRWTWRMAAWPGYRVTDIHPVVAWDALEYLAPTSTERLTLQTCLTYDDTAPRFIVIAEPTSGV